jgi:hypothetical protein
MKVVLPKKLSEADIAKLILDDLWMMKVLRATETLNLPDWWIGAGFLRNKVWDAMEGNASHPTKDVDLVYFNADEIAAETDWAFDEHMKREFPFAEWEVRNQARMHHVNGFDPYVSTADGISHWVETATCVAVKIENGTLKFLFCYGTDDLLGLVARPTPFFADSKDLMQLFHERVDKKQWRQKWPHLQVHTSFK